MKKLTKTRKLKMDVRFNATALIEELKDYEDYCTDVTQEEKEISREKAINYIEELEKTILELKKTL